MMIHVETFDIILEKIGAVSSSLSQHTLMTHAETVDMILKKIGGVVLFKSAQSVDT